MSSSSESYDYIVVGAGSSGCVVARRLLERSDGSIDPSVSVLLLEAGGADDDAHIHRSFVPEIFDTWQSPRITRNYVVERRDGAGTPWPAIARGIVRGGSSAINGMIYVRGNHRDFDRWAHEEGASGWSYEEVLPYFKRSEDFEGGESRYHGADGPMRVRRMLDPTPVAHAFTVATAEKYGHSGNWDFNGEQQEDGGGLYQVNVTEYGTRASTAVAFLDPLEGQDVGLKEKTGMLATRIVISRGKATGVECLNSATGEAVTFHAAREVIVSAGALESPKLLMLSGIGPEEVLKSHGIKTRVALPGVGQNLRDHLLLLVYYESKYAELPEPKFIAESGLFTYTPEHSPSPHQSPDLQYHFCAGMKFFTPPKMPANFLFCPTLAQPHSRGYVTILSDDPRHPPLVEPNYLMVDTDVRVLVHGIELARELVDMKAFDEFRGNELWPGRKLPNESFDSEVDFVRKTARTVWHPVGTCKMGAENDPLAVVDPELKVRGVEGLRVADASVMPSITSGNTNAACIMIGEKAADFVRAAR